MPHLMPMIRTPIRDDLMEQFGSQETFLMTLSALVADAFNEHTGENLEAGRHSRAYEPISTKSLPVDLVVLVVAWWTEDREPHFPAIEQRLQEALSDWWESLFQVEVHLNIIGAPADYEAGPFDFAKGPANA